jgi:hypothetical protein
MTTLLFTIAISACYRGTEENLLSPGCRFHSRRKASPISVEARPCRKQREVRGKIANTFIGLTIGVDISLLPAWGQDRASISSSLFRFPELSQLI